MHHARNSNAMFCSFVVWRWCQWCAPSLSLSWTIWNLFSVDLIGVSAIPWDVECFHLIWMSEVGWRKMYAICQCCQNCLFAMQLAKNKIRFPVASNEHPFGKSILLILISFLAHKHKLWHNTFVATGTQISLKRSSPFDVLLCMCLEQRA